MRSAAICASVQFREHFRITSALPRVPAIDRVGDAMEASRIMVL